MSVDDTPDPSFLPQRMLCPAPYRSLINLSLCKPVVRLGNLLAYRLGGEGGDSGVRSGGNSATRRTRVVEDQKQSWARV